VSVDNVKNCWAKHDIKVVEQLNSTLKKQRLLLKPVILTATSTPGCGTEIISLNSWAWLHSKHFHFFGHAMVTIVVSKVLCFGIQLFSHV
jgi:hypothetical protein